MHIPNVSGKENIKRTQDQFAQKDGKNKLRKYHSCSASYIANGVCRNEREKRPKEHEYDTRWRLKPPSYFFRSFVIPIFKII